MLRLIMKQVYHINLYAMKFSVSDDTKSDNVVEGAAPGVGVFARTSIRAAAVCWGCWL